MHVHSRFATTWAQAGREIPCFGTTHADYFYGPIPVTAPLTAEAIRSEYELNTGIAIVRRFAAMNPLAVPAVLVHGHAPFTWGASATEAAAHAVILEEVAMMAFNTALLNPEARPVPGELIEKHYLRKHGKGAYYGQRGGA